MDLYGFLILPHPLTNFEIQKYFQNEPRFNLDEYSDTGAHWIALYELNNNVTNFDSFGVEHIPKEIKIFIDKSIVVPNIFRIQAYDSVMCGYICIGFIDFILKGKTLTDITNLSSTNNFDKNDDIIFKCFMTNV